MSVDYAALADTIKIEDITSNDINQTILRRLKDNISIHYSDKLHLIKGDQDHNDYILDDGEDIGWLGYYIGQNTTLQSLNESFFKEISCNTSIRKVYFNIVDGKMLSMLGKFFQNNNSLIEIWIDDCVVLNTEGVQQLTLAIRNCNKSLKHVSLTDNEIGDGQLVNIITALSVHPQLSELRFECMNIGRNECTALSTLLRCTTTKLQHLDLVDNNMDDECIEILVHAFVNGNKLQLQELDLSCNRSITIIGWKRVATLLELSDTKLETLNIEHNNIENDGALIFANSLTSNSTLKILHLTLCNGSSRITSEGWAPFSNLLCDTSSVDNTYLSNHTLEIIGGIPTDSIVERDFLLMNSMVDKRRVAMIKILQVHSHFNIQPFFEWEFKVLPLMINWFTKAAACASVFIGNHPSLNSVRINKTKLSVVYDFIREFPMLYIEPVTRKAIAEYVAKEEELQKGNQMGVDQRERLEEIRRCKARAMRRLGMK